MARFPPQKPEDLSPEDKKLWTELSEIQDSFFGDHFVLKQADGSFAGPFATAYELPDIFRGFVHQAIALSKVPELPKDAREAAILVVGAHYNSGFEIYAHERLARLTGLSWEHIDQIKTGRKPADLSPKCEVAYDVAVEMMEGSGRKGRLSDEMWDRSVAAFGKKGSLLLAHYIGIYAYTCILLNAAGVPIPAGESLHTPGA